MQSASSIHKLRTDLHEQVYATICRKVRNRDVGQEQRLFTDDLSQTRRCTLGKYSMKRMSSPPRMGSIGRRPLPRANAIGALLSPTWVVALFSVRALAKPAFLFRTQGPRVENHPQLPAGTAGEPDFYLSHFPTSSAQDVSKEESRWPRNR